MAAYTDLTVVNAGDVLTAAKWNADVQNNVQNLVNFDDVWTAYTPTLAGSTLGNGTITGLFMRIGRTIHFKVRFVLGSTSAVAANTTVTLPVTSTAVTSGAQNIAHTTFVDTGTAAYDGVARQVTTTTVLLRSLGTAGIHTDLTSTSPFTWTTNDEMLVQGTYEASAATS